MINFLKNLHIDGKQLYIFGASQNGKDIGNMFSILGIQISGYFDNALPNGGMKNEIEVSALSVLEKLDRKNTYFFVASNIEASGEIKNQLIEMGFKNILFKNYLALKHYDVYEKISFKKYEKPEVSICLTTYNHWEFLYHCVKTLAENENTCSFELIIGDNCSVDMTQNAEAYFENVTIVHHSSNLSYLGNANDIVSRAKGEYVLLLEDDVAFSQMGYIDKLLKVLKEDETIGAVTGKCWVPLWNRYENAFCYNGDFSVYEVCDDKVSNVEYARPFALLLRKMLWEKIDGYDKIWLPAFCEDQDLSLKIILSGYDVVFFPFAEVIHYFGVTTFTEITHKYVQRNQEIFKNKWLAYIEDLENRERYKTRR